MNWTTLPIVYPLYQHSWLYTAFLTAALPLRASPLSGAVSLELTTCGFGDRRSTNWAIRLIFFLIPCGFKKNTLEFSIAKLHTIELLAKLKFCKSLHLLNFGLLVQGMFPVKGTIFVKFKFFLGITPVFLGSIVPPFTFTALQCYKLNSRFFSSHIFS